VKRIEITTDVEEDGAGSDAIAEGSTQMRIEQYKSLPAMMADHPFLGWGYRSFPAVFELHGTLGRAKGAHSSYAQVGTEEGIVGLVLLVMILFASAWAGVRAARADDPSFSGWGSACSARPSRSRSAWLLARGSSCRRSSAVLDPGRVRRARGAPGAAAPGPPVRRAGAGAGFTGAGNGPVGTPRAERTARCRPASRAQASWRKPGQASFDFRLRKYCRGNSHAPVTRSTARPADSTCRRRAPDEVQRVGSSNAGSRRRRIRRRSAAFTGSLAARIRPCGEPSCTAPDQRPARLEHAAHLGQRAVLVRRCCSTRTQVIRSTLASASGSSWPSRRAGRTAPGAVGGERSGGDLQQAPAPVEAEQPLGARREPAQEASVAAAEVEKQPGRSPPISRSRAAASTSVM